METTSTLSRRRFARLLGGGTLALAGAATLGARPAAAGIGWCRADPLISVNGKTGHVYVESTEDMFSKKAGPILIEFLIPKGTLSTAWAEPLDLGFGEGYTISFTEDRRLMAKGSFVDVRVRAYAPALDGSLPVRVIFHADDGSLNETIKTSTANTWIETGTVKL